MIYCYNDVLVSSKETKIENLFSIYNIVKGYHERMHYIATNYAFLYNRKLFNNLLKNSSNLDVTIDGIDKENFLVTVKGLYEFEYKMRKLTIGNKVYFELIDLKTNDPSYNESMYKPNFENSPMPVRVQEERKRLIKK